MIFLFCLCSPEEPEKDLMDEFLEQSARSQWRRKMFLSRGAESKEVKTCFTRV